jgi:RNA polymerase sigma-70 factor (ECF subfamily)
MRVEPHPSGASPGSLAGSVCLDMLLRVGSGGGEDSRTAAREDEERWRAWMQRAQTGDREAYTLLLDELSGVIRAFVRKTLGDVPLVDDCVQESLIAIHDARRSYDPRRRFRPWMFAIVRHKTIDAVRRVDVRRRHELEPADMAGGREEAPAAERAAEARRVLQGLTEPFREALVLTKYEGYTIDEAAARAGISATAMKTRVHRALRRVRRLLEEQET